MDGTGLLNILDLLLCDLEGVIENFHLIAGICDNVIVTVDLVLPTANEPEFQGKS